MQIDISNKIRFSILSTNLIQIMNFWWSSIRNIVVLKETDGLQKAGRLFYWMVKTRNSILMKKKVNIKYVCRTQEEHAKMKKIDKKIAWKKFNEIPIDVSRESNFSERKKENKKKETLLFKINICMWCNGFLKCLFCYSYMLNKNMINAIHIHMYIQY